MEKKLRYLYLDDNDKVTRDGDVEHLNAYSNKIEIVTDYPGSWAQRTKQILNELDCVDGIILDWELTNKSEQAKQETEQDEDVDFSAESLAEHLRINVVKSGTRDIPIILCSADKNKAFSKIRAHELTSKNLFDLTFIKSDLFDKRIESSEVKLFDLAMAYNQIQTGNCSIRDILQITEEEIEFLDIRFVDSLDTICKSKTTHDLIYFLLNTLIIKEGILINERVLAARLGIDIDLSGDEWQKVKQILVNEAVIFRGILSYGWLNFWAFKLEYWWHNNFPDNELRTTGAKNRVCLLNERFGIMLIASEKIKFCTSDEFWTVCVGLKKPLDPANGFMVSDSPKNPWLEEEYVSGFAELEKSGNELWRINVIDRERYLYFKKIITKEK